MYKPLYSKPNKARNSLFIYVVKSNKENKIKYYID